MPDMGEDGTGCFCYNLDHHNIEHFHPLFCNRVVGLYCIFFNERKAYTIVVATMRRVLSKNRNDVVVNRMLSGQQTWNKHVFSTCLLFRLYFVSSEAKWSISILKTVTS